MLHLGDYNNIIISKLMVYLIGGYNNSQYFLINMMLCWFTVGRASISCILARNYQQFLARDTECGNTLMR